MVAMTWNHHTTRHLNPDFTAGMKVFPYKSQITGQLELERNDFSANGMSTLYNENALTVGKSFT